MNYLIPIKHSHLFVLCISLFMCISAFADGQDSLTTDTIPRRKFLTGTQNEYAPVIPDFPYQSPEVSSFQRYGKQEFNEYTGCANVNIPLYTIKCRDIEIPLSLNYHGGGIKVDEEASWVGLGWNLSIGGCITRIVVGNSSEGVSRTANWNIYQSFLSSVSGEYASVSKYSTEINSTLLGDLRNGVGTPNIYSAYILGQSFLFFRNPARHDSIDIIGNNPLHYIVTDYHDSRRWKVTDDMGYIYEFNHVEEANGSSLYPIASYLSKITSPTGATATFNYSSKGIVKLLPQIIEYHDVIESYTNHTSANSAPFPYPLTAQRSLLYDSNEMNKCYLTSITTDNQTLSFYLSSRNDIYGDSKKLDSLVVVTKCGGQKVKKVAFNYSYFDAGSNNVGGDYMKELHGTSSMEQQKKLRLKLVSVSEGFVSSDLLTHSFVYEESLPLPKKTSYAKDFWGYYNGQENKSSDLHTLIPRPFTCWMGMNKGLGITLMDMNTSYAIRLANEQYAKLGSLKRIVYPTGGYTDYEYELNQFESNSSTPYYPATSVLSSVLHYTLLDNNSSNPNASNQTHKEFTVPSGVTYDGYLKFHVVTDHSTAYSLNYLKTIGCTANLMAVKPPMTPRYTVTIDGDHNPNSVFEYTRTIPVTLTSNNYVFNCILPDAVPAHASHYVTAELYLVPRYTLGTLPSKGAGLRIKSASSYNHDGSLAERTEYDYNYQNGKTSGKLLLLESFAGTKSVFSVYRYEVFSGANGSIIEQQGTHYDFTHYGVGSGIPAITRLLAPSTVGYSRVTKQRMGGNLPVVTTIFTNYQPVKRTRDYYFFNDDANGNVLQQFELTTSGDTLRKTVNTYSNRIPGSYRCNITEDYIAVFSGNASFGDAEHIGGERCNLIQVFPYKLGWSQLASTTTTEYFKGFPSITTKHTYNYSDKVFAVSRDTESSSVSGESYITDYTYLGDLTDNITKGARQRNMLKQPVQQSLSLKKGSTTQQLQSKKTQFTFHSRQDSYLPAYEEYLESGSFKSRLDYGYDLHSNINEITKDNADKVVCLWSYNYTYPVVRIEGASYSDVQNWLSAATINALAASNSVSDIAAKVSAIRQTLASKGVLVTTYQYKPTIGISSTTAPNGQVTSYEYDTHGRLKAIKDHNGKTVEQYTYHYRN